MGKLFGEYIRTRREALLQGDARFSIRKVADRIRVHHSYLSKIERGEPGSLSEKKVVALACELGEDPDLLLAMNGRISESVSRAVARYPSLFRSVVENLRKHCAGQGDPGADEEACVAMLVQVNRLLEGGPGCLALHELRSPLAGIVSAAEAILASDSLAREPEELLRGMMHTARRLVDSIDDSLVLDMIEAGRYRHQPEPVDMLALLDDVWAELRALAGRRSIGLRVELDGRPLDWDHDRGGLPARRLLAAGSWPLCRAVIANLLRCALETGPEGGDVTVRLAGGGQCVLEIHNGGEVPEEMRQRYFDRYASFGTQGGVGLSTYAIRSMARAMGGSVALSTGQEEGTTLRVVLPGHG
jgi:transcriptional regulator with XRE-family HTH domain